jgi:hypothetical protein
MLRSLKSTLQLRLGASPLGAWQQWKPGLLTFEILSRLLDPNRPGNGYAEPEGGDLRAVVAKWVSLGHITTGSIKVNGSPQVKITLLSHSLFSPVLKRLRSRRPIAKHLKKLTLHIGVPRLPHLPQSASSSLELLPLLVRLSDLRFVDLGLYLL